VTELSKGDIELRLKVRNPTQLYIGLGPEPFNSFLHLPDHLAGGFEVAHQAVLAWWAGIAFLAAFTLRPPSPRLATWSSS
jgi:hypothetical protein